MKSVSMQASAVENVIEISASDLLMKCGAFCALLRENIDCVVIQIICWLPALLMQ